MDTNHIFGLTRFIGHIWQILKIQGHTLTDFERFERNVQPEVNLLGSLYSGFDGINLTQEKLTEWNNTLSQFPASSLGHKLKNPSLNKLSKKLTKLNMHSELMKVLARKYGLSDPRDTLQTKILTLLAHNYLARLEVTKQPSLRASSQGWANNNKNTGHSRRFTGEMMVLYLRRST